MKKVVLVDGHNLLFRMFFGIPSSIKNSKGNEIKGLVGFIGSIKKIISEFNPYSLVVVFDSETSRDNNLIFDDEYKADRLDYTDLIDNPFSQLPLIQKALDYLNIFNIEVSFNEADDYIASIVKNNKDFEYIIVSTDSDFIQLVDKNTKLYVPRGKNSVLYDENKVFEKYGIFPCKYVLYKSLIGDKSDNISGVKGIGNKTAENILKFDSIEHYNLENNGRISKLLEENKTKIEKNIKLITLNDGISTDEVKFEKLNSEVLNLKTYEIIDRIGER